MVKPSQPVELAPESTRGLLASYSIGFILSLGLTMLAYWSITRHWLSGGVAVIVLLGLAILQFAVQLFFFLHVGRETRPRWKLLMLFLAIIFVLILVLGSLWVMYSLDYHMTPEKAQRYLQQQDGGI